MEYRTTKHQVARSTRPDWEDHKEFVLIKAVSELRATYQIKLLAHRAVEEKKKLIIEIPKECKIHDDLKALAKSFPRVIKFMRDPTVSLKS